ncbi:unnamed protein product [Phyllotreta striolata]|uniref:Uncharacterized protein n=1 Tax=Phyllotreta striolata TaxID=444603 RepID=A0A9N9TQA7_PHYSR|nr:unnamed protein product [Phyllotreta striolata]
MSRRLPPQNHLQPDNNPYQDTTLSACPAQKPPHNHHNHQYQGYQKQWRNSLRHNGYRKHLPTTTIDIGYSGDTTDTQTYDYYRHHNGFQHSPLKESRNTDVTFSDDSGSTRLPYFEFDDESNKRYSRHSCSSRSFGRPSVRGPPVKSSRKVYPNQEPQLCEQLYHEISTPTDVNAAGRSPGRLAERPQSSMSSGVTSAIVHGCGGRCQTFENVCYFFLQLIFTMGILIGVSLYIAGIVLRKSAARNLQVLMYIGILLSLVCGLLLGIQYDARKTARKRKRAVQMAKRAPIPLENLHLRVNPMHQQQVACEWGTGNRRNSQLPRVHGNVNRPLPLRPSERDSPAIVEEPGIPWWRRKDLNAH